MKARNTITLFKRTMSGLFRGGYFLFRKTFTENIRPEFLWLEVTDRCNCRCIFCNIWQKKATPDPLSPYEIEKALKNPIFNHLKVIVLSGGEPMLRKEIQEILIAVHRAVPNVTIAINSNGLLSDKLLEAVLFSLQNGMVIDVGISLDGWEEHHDRVRGVDGLFKRVDSLMHDLVILREQYKDQLAVTIGSVISDATINELKTIHDYADSLGVSFNPQWFSRGDYYGNSGYNQLSNATTIERVMRSQSLSISTERGIHFLKGASVRFSCFSMFNFCILKCNGDLVPCFNFWKDTVGNIREKDPMEIWKCEKAGQSRKQVKKCSGCLCTCAVAWSFDASFFPRLLFNLRHPSLLLQKLCS